MLQGKTLTDTSVKREIHEFPLRELNKMDNGCINMIADVPLTSEYIANDKRYNAFGDEQLIIIGLVNPEQMIPTNECEFILVPLYTIFDFSSKFRYIDTIIYKEEKYCLFFTIQDS